MTTLSLPKWRVWFLATRPQTLIASFGPVLLGSVICKKIDVFIFFCTLLTALLIQIGTNLANDYFDFIKGADTKARVGPLRATQSGLLAAATVKKGFILVFCCSALCALTLIARGGLPIALLAILSILLGILYTAGPYPIAYLGLSELFVLSFFGFIATAATTYLQTKEWNLLAALAGLGPGALSCCILCLNNLRDLAQDKIAGKKTLVVRFGKIFGKWEYTCFLLMALGVPCLFLKMHPVIGLVPALLFVPAVFLIHSLFRQTPQYSSLFKGTVWLFISYTLIFVFAWLY